MHSRISFIVLFALVTTFTQAAAFEPKRNRWSIGGTGGTSLDVVKGGFIVSWTVDLQPQASYFVWDNVEIIANASFKTTLLSGEKSGFPAPVDWGLGLKSRYVFELDKRFFPYLGALYSGRMQNFWSESFVYDIGIFTGVIIAIKDGLTLDVGVPFTLTFAGGIIQNLKISTVYLGMSYYF